MEIKVLVAYASTHGSTCEVAEAVAATLQARGLVVDVQPARSVRTLQGYGAVVLGASLYMFHIHKDALRFLSRHRMALTQGLPIAIFAGGPIASADEKAPVDENAWQEVRKHLDQELAAFPWLTPVAVEVVGGKFDPNALRFPWNLLPALHQMPPSDLRDWEAVRRWAFNLPERFQQTGLN